MSFESIDAEHSRRYRAERVRTFLEEVWGNAMPDSPDPVITVLVDAVAADDLFGAEAGLVVQGDGLSYRLLAEVLHRSVALRAESVLSPRLLAGLQPYLRSVPAQRSAADVVDLRTPPEPVGPSAPDEGAWELDLATGVVTWCAGCAQLIGAGEDGGSAPWDEHVRRTVHPDDQRSVHTSLLATWTTGRPYDLRFRTRMPGNTWSWRRAKGRRLQPPSGQGPRVVGLLTT